MQESRRSFLTKLGGATAGSLIATTFNPLMTTELKAAIKKVKNIDPKITAQDEVFWRTVKNAYKQSSHFINLENGYFNPQPEPVKDAFIDNVNMVNNIPSYYMRKRRAKEKLELKQKLADFAGCSAEEIVINRNTTEALNTIVSGIKLNKGDEVVISNQDYGSMRHSFKQKEKREGIVVKEISLPLLPDSMSEFVKAFEDAITDKTKLLHVTHMINLTGQLLPVREICDMAHKRGVEVVVDAAHSFAHIDFKIPDLHCDYLGTSLHKWLAAPMGNGLMYIKKDKIKNIWPLMAELDFGEDDIRKFEHLGTLSPANWLTISDAIDFHNNIGSKLKEERLRYLKNYWLTKVKDLPKVKVNTSLQDEQSCGIANIGIEGIEPVGLADKLFDEYKIYTVGIKHKEYQGIRVSPNTYINTRELDLFVEGIKLIAKT